MKNKTKKAFTLAEIAVVLTVIGVLAVILLKAMNDLQPDREKNMFKKAYQNAERIVGELVNDESIYPYDPERIGFYNTDRAEIEGTTTSFLGAQKFCQFFARKLNTFNDPVWDGENSQCTFSTTDGMSWIVPSNFNNNAAAGALVPTIRMTVDINGTESEGGKGPDSADDDVLHRDIYTILVDFDGRMRVDGEREIEYLRSHEATRDRF